MRKINPILLGCACLVICAGSYFILFPMISAQLSGQKEPIISFVTYDTPLGTVSINAKLPESPPNITLYRVVPSKNDMAFFSVDNLLEGGPNIPSESEAPIATEVALLPYGGLPAGAKLTFVKTEYIETFDSDTHKIIEREPISTNVQYRRYIDDKPVVGEGGSIYLDLGKNGSLIYLIKVWRNVTPAGTVSVIPVSAAIEKMKRGELLGHRPKCACELNVNKIGMGYYEKGRDETQDYLEPVWIFSGTLSSGDTWNYYVYARESVGSTITTAPDSHGIKDSVISEKPSDPLPPEVPKPGNFANATANSGNISR
jgi:hypothetical protein